MCLLVCLLFYSAYKETPLLPVRSCKIYKAHTAFAQGRIFCHYHAVAQDLGFCSFTQKDKQGYMYGGHILARSQRTKAFLLIPWPSSLWKIMFLILNLGKLLESILSFEYTIHVSQILTQHKI